MNTIQNERCSEMLPSSDGILIPGKRGKLFAHSYLPGGVYPKPVIILCHGIPGNERLFDFSIYFREHGFCTLNFHYSGSWGSDGTYSLSHCVEDTASVVGYVQRNESGFYDTDNIFVVGHSLGGLMASYAIASIPAVRGGALLAPFNARNGAEPVVTGKGESFLYDLFSTGTEDFWLKGFLQEEFVAELKKEPERYDLVSYAKGLSQKPVFLAAAGMDTVCCPKELHGSQLSAAINSPMFVYREYETDHCFNLQRAEVKKDITDFLLHNLQTRL